jgi:WD40 repeat protein
VDDGKEIRKVGPLPASITALCFRNDAGQLAVAGDDKVIRVLAAGDGKTVKELKGHGDRITSLAFAPLDGNQVFSGSTDKTARLWNVNEARVVREFSGHSDAVLAVLPSRDGSKLATGSADRTARLWNVGDSKLVATLSGHGGPVLSAAASGDGKLVATGSADQVVRFWDASTGRELERLSAHQGAITGVAILPDNASVVSSAADGAIRVWKPAAVRIFTGHEGPTHAVVAHPIGSQVATGSADKSAKVFDLNNGNLIRSPAIPTPSARLSSREMGPGLSRRAMIVPSASGTRATETTFSYCPGCLRQRSRWPPAATASSRPPARSWRMAQPGSPT